MLQGGKQGRALVFGTGGQQLQHREILEAIDSDTRHAVGLAGDQTVSVQTVSCATQSRQLCACCRRRMKKSMLISSSFWKVRRVRGSATRANSRAPATCPAVENIDGFTGEGFTLNALNGTGEHPRVATE